MRRVLLVESDPELLTTRGDELAADGFEPILAGSTPAARAKLPAAEVMIIGALDTVPAALEMLRDVRAGRVPGADPGVTILTLGADQDHQLIRHYQAGADIALPSSASPLLITASVQALSAHSSGALRGALKDESDHEQDARFRALRARGDPRAVANAGLGETLSACVAGPRSATGA